MTYLDLLAEHGLDPIETSGGSEIAVRCPFCQDERPRLYANAETGAWICFRCEERGGPYRLLREVVELDHFQAMRAWERIKSKETRPPPLRPKVEQVPVEQGITMPPEVHPLLSPRASSERIFWDYLRRRGLSATEVRQNRMGFALRGSYAYRVVIPVYSEGVMWTFVARSIIGGEPKTLHPPGSHPGHALFGIDRVTSPLIYLVEGIFDAIKIGTDAVASLGTNLSARQRALLRHRGVKAVVLLWDGDEPGRHGAARIADQLHAARFDVRVALLPPGHDPASADWDTIYTAVEEALPVHGNYLSEVLSADRLDAAAPK